jgi:hypothetical protein
MTLSAASRESAMHTWGAKYLICALSSSCEAHENEFSWSPPMLVGASKSQFKAQVTEYIRQLEMISNPKAQPL